MRTQLFAPTSARVTNWSAVTGSSSSGSVTVSSCLQTSALRPSVMESGMLSLGSVDGFGEMRVSARRLDLLFLRRNVDAIQSSRIKTQNLLLCLKRQN